MGTQQTISIPPGTLAFVVATAQSSRAQRVLVRDSTGAVVFCADGKRGASGSLTLIGQGSFVSAGDGTHTVELSAGGILRAAQALAHRSDRHLTAYAFGLRDSGAQTSPRAVDDLVVLIQVFRAAG